ncbi:MAG: bifunctional oligoribonuclease/PAP phosphatase NrnA [Candidatus Hodarchaeota archaeon]
MRGLPTYQGFIECLQTFKGKIVLVMHSQADLDAVGATIAMTQWINQINPKLSIWVLEPDFSLLGYKLVELTSFQYKTIEIDQLMAPALCIFLDTCDINPKLLTLENKFAVFDHHVRTSLDVVIDFDFRLDSFRSTAEIITSLYYYTNASLTPQVAKGLLAGIIFDTKRFLLADQNLFESVNFLLTNNHNIYSEVLTLFATIRSQSEKVACIKAAQRMKKYQIKNKIVLVSHVSSYEAAAARSLIALGGDVAIVIANRKEETRISFRTTPEFPIETNISIGRDIIPALIKKFGGTGGGHDGAAGYNNNEVLDKIEVKNLIFQVFQNVLTRGGPQE